MKSGRESLNFAGRLFALTDKDDDFVRVFTGWQGSDKLLQYKKEILEFFKKLGISEKYVMFQSENDKNSEFHTYDQAMSRELPSPDSEARRKEWNQKVHALKGMLPAGWGRQV